MSSLSQQFYKTNFHGNSKICEIIQIKYPQQSKVNLFI